MMAKQNHGGVRIGAGAPRKIEVAKSRTMRLIDADWLKFKEMGGVKWLKRILQESQA